MFVEIFIFAILCFLLYINSIDKERKYLPPGEFGLPIIGYMPQKGDRITATILKLRKKHGDLFIVKIGSRLFLFICNYLTVKDLLSRMDLAGRPDFYTFMSFRKFQKKGIIMAESSLWTTNRRFALKVLKDFGFGRSSIAEAIGVEVEMLISFFKSKNDQPMNIDWSLDVAVVNVLMKLTLNRRFDKDDPELRALLDIINAMLVIGGGPIDTFNYFPFMQHIMPLFLQNKFLRVNELQKLTGELRSYFLNVVLAHKKTLIESSPRDYIDMYLIEYGKDKNNPDSEYKDDNYFDLVCSLADLFFAGSETTSSTIRWYCLYMCKYPEIQRKIREEIDSVVPRDMRPTMDDKENLPFTEASIYEVHRICSLIPLGVVHAAIEDAYIDNYIIPKGTIIAPAIEVCHKDPKYWKKPTEFYPEHFLDENGKFCIPKEGFMPFGLGRRQCLGESMAKMELFLMISAILQNFEIKEPEGQIVTLEVDAIHPVLNLPKSQELFFEHRK